MFAPRCIRDVIDGHAQHYAKLCGTAWHAWREINREALGRAEPAREGVTLGVDDDGTPGRSRPAAREANSAAIVNLSAGNDL